LYRHPFSTGSRGPVDDFDRSDEYVEILHFFRQIRKARPGKAPTHGAYQTSRKRRVYISSDLTRKAGYSGAGINFVAGREIPGEGNTVGAAPAAGERRDARFIVHVANTSLATSSGW
jgi:hypothetical protein